MKITETDKTFGEEYLNIIYNLVVNDNIYVCPICNKKYSVFGIKQHIRYHFGFVNNRSGKKSWNNGLTKETSDIVKKYGKTISDNLLSHPEKNPIVEYNKYSKDRIENCRKGGLNSSVIINRRSKNEILFANKCIEYFGEDKISLNSPMFDGWDADIILHKFKIAVLWNGIWHYKKVRKKQSLIQTINRDKIKCDKIISFGYEVYIIKDMGKHNPEFVEKEFEKFLYYVNSNFI